LAYPWKRQLAGLWHSLRGRREQAFADYTAVLDQAPADFTALYTVLQHLQRKGQDEEALHVAERALAKEPDHFLALQTAACLSVKLDRLSDAKEYTERSLEAMPDVRAGSTPILDGFANAALWVARLLRRPRAMGSSPPEVPSSATERELGNWRRWATGYLAWYAAQTASGDPEDGE
jgi:tetratricopeptide (TPR) repeat protein